MNKSRTNKIWIQAIQKEFNMTEETTQNRTFRETNNFVGFPKKGSN